jgi:hypothetical protein
VNQAIDAHPDRQTHTLRVGHSLRSLSSVKGVVDSELRALIEVSRR